jgi:2-polyprenyl-3-methyl-5-hydroxy-6-metoxy-1,4-benzoquinol methylase
MNAAALEAFYEHGYRSLYQASEEPTQKDLVMQEIRAERTLSLVSELIPDIQRHLDIGSSTGALLKTFKDKYRCESIGIEPGEKYRKYSNDSGILTYTDIQALQREHPAPFDLLSMMHVLEHLRNPIDDLIDLRKNLLSPDAYLLVEVPNLYEHQALETAHLYAFSPRTLRYVLERAGFRILWTHTHGSFRSPVLKLFTTCLACVNPEPISIRTPITIPGWIKLRREIGKVKQRVFTRLLPDWTWQAPKVLWDEDLTHES